MRHGRKNEQGQSLTYAIVALSCVLAALLVLGAGLRYAEAARQQLVMERTERSQFIMGCVEHQQINTCRVLYRMAQERQGSDGFLPSSFGGFALAALSSGARRP